MRKVDCSLPPNVSHRMYLQRVVERGGYDLRYFAKVEERGKGGWVSIRIFGRHSTTLGLFRYPSDYQLLKVRHIPKTNQYKGKDTEPWEPLPDGMVLPAELIE